MYVVFGVLERLAYDPLVATVARPVTFAAARVPPVATEARPETLAAGIVFVTVIEPLIVRFVPSQVRELPLGLPRENLGVPALYSNQNPVPVLYAVCPELREPPVPIVTVPSEDLIAERVVNEASAAVT